MSNTLRAQRACRTRIVYFFAFGVIVFFASLRRLHRQLVHERRKQIDWARDLYCRAYEPVLGAVLLAAVATGLAGVLLEQV